MKSTLLTFVLFAAVLGNSAVAQPSKQGNAGERTSVDLTIYNQNLSLIREERTFSLVRGFSSVVVPDIPSTIDGTSVHFMSLTAPDAVRVLEQNYQYDLVHQAKLLERYAWILPRTRNTPCLASFSRPGTSNSPGTARASINMPGSAGWWRRSMARSS